MVLPIAIPGPPRHFVAVTKCGAHSAVAAGKFPIDAIPATPAGDPIVHFELFQADIGRCDPARLFLVFTAMI